MLHMGHGATIGPRSGEINIRKPGGPSDIPEMNTLPKQSQTGNDTRGMILRGLFDSRVRIFRRYVKYKEGWREGSERECSDWNGRAWKLEALLDFLYVI